MKPNHSNSATKFSFTYYPQECTREVCVNVLDLYRFNQWLEHKVDVSWDELYDFWLTHPNIIDVELGAVEWEYSEDEGNIVDALYDFGFVVDDEDILDEEK